MKEISGEMRHIDEHTLELFLLGDEQVLKRAREIEAHLDLCPGCQQLFLEMKEFYMTTHKELDENPKLGAKPERALIRRAVQYLSRKPEEYTQVYYEPLRGIEKFRYYMKKYSVPIRVGGVGLLSIAFMLFLFFPRNNYENDRISDRNPVRYDYIDSLHSIAVYNSARQQLWTIPYWCDRPTYEVSAKMFTTLIDLNNDGRNELVTFFPVDPDDWTRTSLIRIYSPDGDSLFSRDLGKNVSYKREDYPNVFICKFLLTGDFDENKIPELYVGLGNFYSPFVLLKLNEKLEVIGAYWHFGHFLFAETVSVVSPAKKRIALSGSYRGEHDLGEASIAIIDPSRLIGKSSSMVTPGFNTQMPSPEIYYIKVLRSPIDEKMKTKPRFDGKPYDDSTLTYSLSNENRSCIFNYSFSRNDLSLLNIRKTDVAAVYFKQRNEEGVFSTILDDTYLRFLQNKVRYWDGKQWIEEATMIRH
ncbi:MAG: hypothetical protein V1799_03640 [bacterium]